MVGIITSLTKCVLTFKKKGTIFLNLDVKLKEIKFLVNRSAMGQVKTRLPN